MDSANDRIPGPTAHHNPRRATVMNCPYCTSENLFPAFATDNAWQCRDCRRLFSVKLHGHLDRGVDRGAD
ncbi:MAG: hypothetical protein L0K02_03330 [Corynebacterium sp.]|nr:hypothetical protein [Corynebacterium sp.]